MRAYMNLIVLVLAACSVSPVLSAPVERYGNLLDVFKGRAFLMTGKNNRQRPSPLTISSQRPSSVQLSNTRPSVDSASLSLAPAPSGGASRLSDTDTTLVEPEIASPATSATLVGSGSRSATGSDATGSDDDSDSVVFIHHSSPPSWPSFLPEHSNESN
jgi:hypothetical protein